MSVVTSVGAALVAGSVLGVRHALETDHLAAVATLVRDGRAERTPGAIGVSWGVGHALPILAVGLAFAWLGLRVPDAVGSVFEAVVGVVLVVLGARMLLGALGALDAYRHSHGLRAVHAHLRIGGASLGLSHRHLHGDSFLVGVLHGLAGSGALVVVLASTAPTVGAALAFLLAFSALSVVTMGIVSVVWNRTLDTAFASALRLAAGALGVGVGLLLLAEQVAAVGPF
ncbi:high-affinity nickel-transporter protein [Halomarina halobia]|uniref:High-affinity nickel-transporter protein n=1 Tax=Halomarina halobia TaxID=3033386 RepID=A0ABD6A6Z5_9EURY|nr:hypothetical protein [Halomarina sp. PSR21]